MRRIVACLFAFALLAIIPSTPADAPDPMIVEGVVGVNGGIPAEGTRLTARTAEGVLAHATTDASGGFTLNLSSDDPATPAREGAREGDVLTFEILGGASTPGAAFTPGAYAHVNLTLALPDLAIVAPAASPGEIRQGDNVTVRFQVANRGEATASGVRALVTEGGRTLAGASLGDVAAGASRSAFLAVDTSALSGARVLTLLAEATAGGEATPGNNRQPLPLDVSPDLPPKVTAFRHAPASPLPGQPVSLRLEAEDDDDAGVSHVRFFWQDGSELRSHNATESPYRAVLGTFPANATVEYWAVVSDGGPVVRSTTTPRSAFTVREASPGTSAEGEPSVEAEEDAPAEPRTSGPGVAAVAAAALGSAVAYARRRRPKA